MILALPVSAYIVSEMKYLSVWDTSTNSFNLMWLEATNVGYQKSVSILFWQRLFPDTKYFTQPQLQQRLTLTFINFMWCSWLLFVEHQLLYLGDVSHCLDTGIHPSPQEPAVVRAGKVLSSTIVIYEKWKHRGEGDRNSRGGLHTVKRVAHVGFRGCPCVCGQQSCHQSSASPFRRG